ncbi:PREDICTED: complement component C8 gamma chain, partial [Bison bison bison]|uniref:Complement component C8 gamma chain n=1 Tax=Bison bison bison TaxID=43346 RepID=A0A6P3HI22_BISBB
PLLRCGEMNVQRGDLPDPGFKPGSPALQVDSEPPGGQRPEVNLDFGHRTWRPAPAGKRRAKVRCPGSLGQRVRRPPRPPSPISTIQPKANFDAQQFSGTWLLVAVASPCRYLQEQGHRAEATTLHVAPQGSAMVVSTFRKLDGICWAVRQLYGDTGRPGRFLLQGEAVAAGGGYGAGEPGADPEEIQVYDTDYASFALLLSKKQSDLQRILRVSLLCRIWAIQTQVLDKFVCLVRAQGLSDDSIVFPDLT